MTRLFLGVDGGQSSTTALIGDQTGAVLGKGVGGPCNHVCVAEGPAKLQKVVQACVGQACNQLGLKLTSTFFESVCFGMSGGPDDKVTILSEILNAEDIFVTNDAVIALTGSLGGGPGVVTIAGTGSIAYGRNADGRVARAGGWGYLFGDEGGAFDIVRQAVRVALRSEEGWGPKTRLSQALMDATGACTINELLHSFYTTDWPRSRIATLASEVSRVANESDPEASTILETAGDRLAEIALAVRAQLWAAGTPVAASYIGGVFQSQLVLEQFRRTVELKQDCKVNPPLMGAAEGALLEAYRRKGVSPSLDKLLTSIV